MSYRVELVIPGDSNDLSPNERIHWRKLAKLKKHWSAKAYLVAKDALNCRGIEPPQSRVQVSFVVRRGKALDPDNAASSAALKAILDGLVAAGLLGGDTLRHCERGAVTQEIDPDWRERPEVVIIIEGTV